MLQEISAVTLCCMPSGPKIPVRTHRPCCLTQRLIAQSSLRPHSRSYRLSAIITERGPSMTLTIDLPDEQSAALAAKARARGLSAEQYARQVLENDIAPEWLQKSWESSRQAGLDQLSAEEIDAEIAAARKARPQPAHDFRREPNEESP